MEKEELIGNLKGSISETRVGPFSEIPCDEPNCRE